MDLQKALEWRYAVKKYSPRKVSEENIGQIMDAIHLSASSAGLQPYRIFVINDEHLRKDLRADSFNAQIEEASHLIVFAAFENITKQHIEEYISLIASERKIPAGELEGFKVSLEANLLSRPETENFRWTSNQAYIALGTALVAAADLEIDSTPMEGFNREKLDNLLDLKSKGLKSVVLLALGYRDEEKDIFAKLKKVRLSKEKLIITVELP